MSTFDDRQKGYENKFAYDQEIEFKVRSKRNRLIALWAADRMHLDDAAVEAYATQVVESTVDGSPDDSVCNKILSDIREKGFEIEEREVRAEMERFSLEARESFK